MRNWKTWQKWALYIVIGVIVYYLIYKFWPKSYKNVNGTPCQLNGLSGTWQKDVCVTITQSANNGQIKYNF